MLFNTYYVPRVYYPYSCEPPWSLADWLDGPGDVALGQPQAKSPQVAVALPPGGAKGKKDVIGRIRNDRLRRPDLPVPVEGDPMQRGRQIGHPQLCQPVAVQVHPLQALQAGEGARLHRADLTVGEIQLLKVGESGRRCVVYFTVL